MATVLIDLDAFDPPRSARRRGGRRALVALVVLLILAAAAGSTGPPPRLRPLWTVSGVDWFGQGEDAVYVSLDGAAESREPDSGRVRWRASVDGVVQAVDEVGHGLVAFTVYAKDHETSGDPRATTVLVERATGAVMATLPGAIAARSANWMLLVRVECVGPDPCSALTAVSLPAGVVGWSMPLTEWRGLTVDDATGVLALVTAGDLELRSLTTGALLRTTSLGPVDPVSPGNRFGVIVAGQLVVVRADSGQITVDAQPLTGSTTRWSLTIARSDGQAVVVGLIACGRLLCLTGIPRTAVIDPVAGVLLSSVDGLVSTASGWADDPLLALEVSAEGVLTGFRMLRANDLSVIGPTRLATPPVWSASDGRVLAAERTPGRTRLVVLDRRGHGRLVGDLPGADQHCWGYGPILACLRERTLTIWHLPSADELAFEVGAGRP